MIVASDLHSITPPTASRSMPVPPLCKTSMIHDAHLRHCGPGGRSPAKKRAGVAFELSSEFRCLHFASHVNHDSLPAAPAGRPSSTFDVPIYIASGPVVLSVSAEDTLFVHPTTVIIGL